MIIDPKAILSIIGPHAGESPQEIIDHKSEDIVRIGQTFWLTNSLKITPGFVQRFCSEECPIWCYMLDPSVPGGARPATTASCVKKFSVDSRDWKSLPVGLSRVTGRITNDTSVLVFDKLELCDNTVDLFSFVDAMDGFRKPSFCLGGSTVAVRYQQPKEMHQYRHIMARARLVYPYCVFVTSKETL